MKILLASEDFTFEVKEELRIGTMRVDFADGSLSNKWTPTELFETISGIEINEVQKIVNDIQFKSLNTFDKVGEECGGYGYKFECNRFCSSDKFNYWIKLIPVKGDYNYYIKVYLKGAI